MELQNETVLSKSTYAENSKRSGLTLDALDGL